jgi:enoyl-CoA hydratase/carnithine racemase
MSLVLTEELEPGILLVTMNRPERLNALSQGLIAELHATFERINTDRSVRVVILTGAGRGFCSGDDLKGVEGEHGAPGTEGMGQIPLILLTQEHLASLHERIHRLRQPVIAAVNGAAVGGGFAMALSCDVRYAAESARFGSVFVTLGVSSCDMGTSYLLPRLVGASLAAELMLTGRIFDAREAREMDLVLDVVSDGTVVERALETARQIVANAPLAVWMTKETMWQTIDAPSFRHALDMENRTQVMCTQTGELSDAAAAFREGRAPEWRPL